MDEYVHASINAVNGIPDPETGHYGHLVYAGIENPERALRLKRNLYNAAMFMHRNKIADVGMHADIRKEEDGTYSIDFFAVDKAMAREYVLRTYGDDPARWPWSPRATDKNFG